MLGPVPELLKRAVCGVDDGMPIGLLDSPGGNIIEESLELQTGWNHGRLKQSCRNRRDRHKEGYTSNNGAELRGCLPAPPSAASMSKADYRKDQPERANRHAHQQCKERRYHGCPTVRRLLRHSSPTFSRRPSRAVICESISARGPDKPAFDSPGAPSACHRSATALLASAGPVREPGGGSLCGGR